MTSEKRTETETRQIIREFLRLPSTAMPGILHMAPTGQEMITAMAWRYVRDYMRPDQDQLYAHSGEPMRLRADRDGWRDGVIVEC